MNKLLFTFLGIILCTNIYSQRSYQSGENVHLWGNIEIVNLLEEPYKGWYDKSQSSYDPDIKDLDFTGLKDCEVRIFLGTWCGDTKNYLPKFIELWQKANLPMKNLNLIAVHNADSLYKQDLDQSESAFLLHRVPTFIFEKNGKEIGRIVESPMTSLEVDVAQIAAGIPSIPRYNSVMDIHEYLKAADQDSLYAEYNALVSKIRGKVSYVGELTTYAKKLHTEGNIAHAEFVYNLAISLYPFHPYSYYRMGAFRYKTGDMEKAKNLFDECEKIRPDYLDTKEYLDKIKS